MAAASSWSFQTFPFPVKRIGMAWKDQKNLLGRSWKLQESEKPGWGLGLGEMQGRVWLLGEKFRENFFDSLTTN